MRANLSISKADNEVEIGILFSSSLDLDSKSMSSFADLAFKSAVDRKRPLLNFHIDTFACGVCPDEMRKSYCLSDGAYCAFFPKEASYD